MASFYVYHLLCMSLAVYSATDGTRGRYLSWSNAYVSHAAQLLVVCNVLVMLYLEYEECRFHGVQACAACGGNGL